MQIDLSGRTALVTGSTAGIGEAAAQPPGPMSWSTAANADRVAETAERIGGRGVTADVGTADGTALLIRRLPDVDILVNNAGVFETRPVFEIPDADWLRLYEVNVLSGVRLARHYAPRMVRRGWGRVIFVSSEAGVQTPTDMVHYGMTKTGQPAVSRGWRRRSPAPGSR